MGKRWEKLGMILIVLCFAVGVIPAGAAEYKSEALNNLYVSEEIDLGSPMRNSQFIHCTFSKEDGRDIVYTSASGKPATLVCYDLAARKVIREIPLPGSGTVWSHGTDSKGNVYIATQSEGRFFKWDPKEKKLTSYGKVVAPDGVAQGALYGISFDEEDNAYVGTYPSGYLTRLNAKTG